MRCPRVKQSEANRVCDGIRSDPVRCAARLAYRQLPMAKVIVDDSSTMTLGTGGRR
jgi:hypothetical protein